jgi:NAD(P)-dependent dehydrogenase (short-subunit alcohol dehydrogenase family)
MPKRVLISGILGNVGTACMARAYELDWQVAGISKRANLDLCDWPATSSWLSNLQAVDLVIMAHGKHHIDRVADLTAAQWHEIMDNNATASASLTSALLKQERLNPDGLIIYCTSIQGSHTRAGRGAYAAAKCAEEGLMRAVAAEIGPDRRALALRMGQLDTQMSSIKLDDTEVARLQARCYTPWVPVTEVAALCFALYDMKHITGTCIELDSGHSKNIW